MEADEIPIFSKFVAKVQDVITAIRCQAILVNNTFLAPKSNEAKGDEEDEDKDKDEKR